MSLNIEQLRSAGVLPSGPVSAWPRSRNDRLVAALDPKAKSATKEIKASTGDMARNLVRVAGQAIANGRVSEEIRNERYETCKGCPAFLEDSKRCSECGCFMEAKTWVGGNPDALCPLKKWSH